MRDTITNQVIKQGSSTQLNKDRNNCTVLALAATIGISYDEAFKIAEDMWQRKTKKGVRTSTLETYFSGHAKKVDIKKIYRVKKDNREVVCKMSVSTFAKEYPKGNYYVLVSRHALAVNDGKILDHASLIQKTKRLVKHAWKIK